MFVLFYLAWFYRWGNNSDKIYASTSEMWCKEKHWQSTIIPAEPAWERDERVQMTFQALKRWSDTNDACLVSLLPESKQAVLCEIVGKF